VKLGPDHAAQRQFLRDLQPRPPDGRGRVYMCLGQDDHVDLRAALREGGMTSMGD
jgi:hypothetical protein